MKVVYFEGLPVGVSFQIGDTLVIGTQQNAKKEKEPA